MNPADFEIYKNLLMEKSGLVLTSDKAYLIDSRLTPIAQKWELGDLNSLTQAIKNAPDEQLITDIVEAMTTNETSFFRDTRPFDTFKEYVLPYMRETRQAQRSFKIWCAAASSGQEPYSIAMLLREDANMAGWNIPITGTDISNEILDQAREGLYSQFEVQRGLPIQLLMRYFVQKDEKWQISDDIKSMIEYKYFNLLENMSSLCTYDVVFCRNVLIYFDEATKKKVLEEMARLMPDDGLLFLGGAETVLGITDVFKPVPDHRGLYTKENSVHFEKSAPSSTTAASPSTVQISSQGLA